MGTTHPAGQDLRELLALAVDIAEEAGRLITEQRPDRLAVATKSTDTDVVTVMDRRSEDLIRARLRSARPTDAVLGEEGDDEAGSSGLTWVVDPIDGTVNYLYGIPAYAVSLALARGDVRRPGHWEPLVGVVVNPVLGETFSALKGGGATLARGGEERPLRASAATELGQALLATGFGYAAETRRRQAGLLRRLLPRVRDIRRMGSAALDLCSLAAGRVDLYHEGGIHAWDLAAGWLIATEAGAIVGGLTAAPSTELTWGAAPGLAAEFGPLIRGLVNSGETLSEHP